MAKRKKVSRNSGAASSRVLTQCDLEKKAVDLRRAGKSFAEIAKAIGTSRGEACKILWRAIAKANAEIKASAEQYLLEELAKLEMLEEGWLPIASDTDDNKRSEAREVVKHTMKERAKYLGLYAPEKSEHDTTINHDHRISVSIEERRQRLASVAERLGVGSVAIDVSAASPAGTAEPAGGPSVANGTSDQTSV